MKKVTFLVVMLAFLANVAMAQNKERVNAYNYNKNAQAYIQTAEQLMVQNRTDKAAKEMNNAKIMLERAKASIDLAANHDETKNDAKTWHYYSVIYLKIATYPEFASLDAEALGKTAQALAKIIELDETYFKQNAGEIYTYIQSVTTNYFNQGAVAYEAGDYVKAIDSYINAYETMAMTLALQKPRWQVLRRAFYSSLSKRKIVTLQYLRHPQSCRLSIRVCLSFAVFG